MVDALKTPWKQAIREKIQISMVLSLLSPSYLKKQVYSLGKLNSKELYNILILGNYKKPASQVYFQAFFEPSTIDWIDIYLILRKITINTKYCSFQYKILNNVLYLNKLLFKFGKAESQLCSFWKSAEEIIIYLFS